MLLLSFLSPVASDHLGDHSTQCVTFGHRQVSLVVFCVDSQHEYRQILAAKEINNSSAAAFAATAKTEPHLANTTAAGNDHAAGRVGRKPIHDGLALVR